MSAEQRGFYFANAAQWTACHFVQADADTLRKAQAVRPFAPYARPGRLIGSDGAHAPVVTRTGDILWRDDHGCLHRLTACEDLPETHPAPLGMARATRIVSTGQDLWVFDSPESLHLFDEKSLTHLETISFPGARIVDLASDGRDALALIERDGRWHVDRVNRRGRLGHPIPIDGIQQATAFVFLRRLKRIVILDGSRQLLYWFSDSGGRALFSIPVAALGPCFTAEALGSDGQDRVFAAGTDGRQFGASRRVLILDADGNSLGDIPLEADHGRTSGIAATRDRLLVASERGLLQFAAAAVVPDGAAVRCTVMTPMLQAPDRADHRRWLRVEASAELPDGSALEIAVASTGSIEVRDRINAILNDPALPDGQRVLQLQREAYIWRGRTEFQGSATPRAAARSAFSAKLFDIRDRYMWVAVTLTASPGSQLPSLSQLAVLYPGRTLMESLPLGNSRGFSRTTGQV